MYSILALLCLVVSTQAFFGKRPYPDWDQLSVTFPNYHGMPQNEEEARSQGWKFVSDGCTSATNFKGKRYSSPDGPNSLLFDPVGNMAGIQLAFPDNSKSPKGWSKAFVKEGKSVVLTAYFTDPNLICSGKRIAPKGYVGDNLYLVMNNGPVKIPLKESDIGATKWTKGKCFYGMGQHYWYDVSKGMDCQNFGPWFLLYNGGNLNAFGFANFEDMVNKYVENPPQRAIRLFFQEKPVCIEKQPHLTTQHIYLQRRPYLNFC
eukprot:TCONS_00006224-protein